MPDFEPAHSLRSQTSIRNINQLTDNQQVECNGEAMTWTMVVAPGSAVGYGYDYDSWVKNVCIGSRYKTLRGEGR